MDNQLSETLALELTEVSRILSETSSQIAVNAAPLATPVKLSANAAPRAPADVAAIAAGAPASVPTAGMPLALPMSSHAVPVAHAALRIAQAVPALPVA